MTYETAIDALGDPTRRAIVELRMNEALSLWPQLTRRLVNFGVNDAELVNITFVQTGPGKLR